MSALALLASGLLWAVDAGQSLPAAPPHEDREVVAELELLERMELLQDIELLRDLDGSPAHAPEAVDAGR